jgi:uncharacterized protein (DUF433 family)
MPIAATLTPREVAELSGAPKRVIEKAIEERVLRVRSRAIRGTMRHARRMLPTHAVAYAAIIMKLDLKLTAAYKKRLLVRLGRLRPTDVRKARVELAPAVEIDIGRLVGDLMDHAEKYRAARDALIVIDKAIKGGTAVIRGTRMSVYSVLGRVEHGETIDGVLADNPDLSREAVEAAIAPIRSWDAGVGARGPMPREAVHRRVSISTTGNAAQRDRPLRCGPSVARWSAR